MKRLLLRLGLVAAAVVAATGVQATPASAAYVTDRTCHYFDTGDRTRELSVCSSLWISPETGVARGLVEMHTYRYVNGLGWVDSTSQSITVNRGYVVNATRVDYGNDYADPKKCRINSPSGTVQCSVTNAYRVAFYSAAIPIAGGVIRNCVTKVSWRDDRGVAHTVTVGDSSSPSRLPTCYPILP